MPVSKPLANIMNNPKIPDWDTVMWRRLEAEELILEGDWCTGEGDWDAAVQWRRAHVWGQKAPDPNYLCNRIYRRVLSAEATDSTGSPATPSGGCEIRPVYNDAFDFYRERGAYQVRINLWGWPAKIAYRLLFSYWRRRNLNPNRDGEP
jgi:hypothetical protein